MLGDVDQLLARVQRRLPADAAALHRLRVLNQFFFVDLGFGGNVNDFYDPDNSYLPAVLRTRRGIPISLDIKRKEQNKGLRMDASGVGFHGHFMVKVHLPKGQVVLDPFTGHSLSREQLAERLEPYRRRSAEDEDAEVPLGLYLQTASPREILARMLRNLKEIHRAQEDWGRLVPVLDRLIVLQPDAWPEYRDRGLAHAALGHKQQAVPDLEAYLRHTDAGQDLDAITDRVAELKREAG